MWPFSKQTTLADSRILNGLTDWHSHILPGVDDGVKTLGESLAILNLYEQLGISSVWLTPHIMSDTPNTTEHLKQRFAELKQNYSGTVTLHLAAEYMLDSLFEERLHSGNLLPLGHDRSHILVETSYFNPPIGFRETLSAIKSAGYYPVLAHPERYAYLSESDYRQLKDNHIRLQLDLFSIFGIYGTEAKKKARWLLKQGMYDLTGTDIHRLIVLQNLLPRKLPAKTARFIANTTTNSV